MFYFILLILIALFYLFAAPSAIKGTLNLMLLVFGLVFLVALLFWVMLGLATSSAEAWVVGLTAFFGLWGLRDLVRLPVRDRKRPRSDRSYGRH